MLVRLRAVLGCPVMGMRLSQTPLSFSSKPRDQHNNSKPWKVIDEHEDAEQ